jgi:hypothetical protein
MRIHLYEAREWLPHTQKPHFFPGKIIKTNSMKFEKIQKKHKEKSP